MSLRLRLTAIYILLLALSLAGFGALLFGTMRQNLVQEMDRRLEVRVSQVELTIWPDTETITAEDLTAAKLDLSPLADLRAPNLYVQVLGRDGQIAATSETLRGATLPVDEASVVAAVQGQRVYDDIELPPHGTLRILNVPIRQGDHIIGVLQVGQSREPLREMMDGLLTQLQLLGAAVLLVSGLVGWTVAHHGLRELAQIARRAATIARARDFSQRLELTPSATEVRQLARTIDLLLATVDDTLRTHREFVADTSHELRNPLLAVRTNLELHDRVEDPVARAECLSEARAQVERLTRLVADLLLLARIEAGQLIERQAVPLQPLLQHIGQEARKRADGRTVRLDLTDDVVVLGDELRIAQIVDNLVDNALAHTPVGGTITLELAREGRWARISVCDTGEGIPPAHLPHVFERFYRVNGAGTGAGLGLAIVKHLAEAHRGSVAVQSQVGVGSRLTVRLPLEIGYATAAPGGAAS